MENKRIRNLFNKNNVVALNKKALYDYYIERKYESGIVLSGWEVKSIRAGKIQIADSYALIKKGECWLLGSRVSPLSSASTHNKNDPVRTRKLLLQRKELDVLFGLIIRRGYNLVPLSMYWKKNFLKIELGLGKGKKKYDKRAVEKEQEWTVQKKRILKYSNL